MWSGREYQHGLSNGCIHYLVESLQVYWDSNGKWAGDRR